MKRRTMMTRCLCLGLYLGVGLAALSVHAKEAAGSLVYIGSRAGQGVAAETQGIYAVRLDSQTGKLTLLGQQQQMMGNSWLAAHPTKPLLFLVNNPGGNPAADSLLYSYSVDKTSGKLQQLSQVASGGKDTTHIYFDAKSNTLFGASFGSGEVTATPVSADGSLGAVASRQKHEGSGPHRRQASSHAHGVEIDPSGRYVLSSDMGADRVYVHGFDPKTRTLTPGTPPFEASPAGTGPRHLAFHPSGKFVYTNTELTADVRAYSWNAKQGRLQLIEAVSAYPADYTGADKSSAEIGASRDGRFLYVTLRGDQDSIVVYAINSKSGKLTEIQRIASQGKSPRSFGIDPSGRWLLVTHDVSNSVNVFGIDKKTGKLNATGEALAIPSAAMIVFYPN